MLGASHIANGVITVQHAHFSPEVLDLYWGDDSWRQDALKSFGPPVRAAFGCKSDVGPFVQKVQEYARELSQEVDIPQLWVTRGDLIAMEMERQVEAYAWPRATVAQEALNRLLEKYDNYINGESN